jgi:hypothetical protein
MEDIDIVCINCDTLINSNQISAHSMECVMPTEVNLNDQSFNPIETINFKIQKLQTAIENTTKKSELRKNPSIKWLFVYLNNKIYEVKINNLIEYYSSRELMEMNEELNLIDIQKVPQIFFLYTERFKALINEKISVLKSDDNSFEDKLGLAIEENCFNTLKIEKKPKKIVESLEKIDEIASIVSPTSRKSFSISSNAGIGSSDLENQESEFEKPEYIQEESFDSLKQYFYSRCLLIKLEYPSTHPVQKIDVKTLYKKSLEQSVEFKDWEFFIRLQFKNLEILNY